MTILHSEAIGASTGWPATAVLAASPNSLSAWRNEVSGWGFGAAAQRVGADPHAEHGMSAQYCRCSNGPEPLAEAARAPLARRRPATPATVTKARPRGRPQ